MNEPCIPAVKREHTSVNPSKIGTFEDSNSADANDSSAVDMEAGAQEVSEQPIYADMTVIRKIRPMRKVTQSSAVTMTLSPHRVSDDADCDSRPTTAGLTTKNTTTVKQTNQLTIEKPSNSDDSWLPKTKSDLISLVLFYKGHCDKLEKERDLFKQELEEILEIHKNRNLMEYRLQYRSDELVDCQKLLSETKEKLFESEKKVIDLTEQVEQLTLNNTHQSDQIKHLLTIVPSLSDRPIKSRSKCSFPRPGEVFTQDHLLVNHHNRRAHQLGGIHSVGAPMLHTEERSKERRNAHRTCHPLPQPRQVLPVPLTKTEIISNSAGVWEKSEPHSMTAEVGCEQPMGVSQEKERFIKLRTVYVENDNTDLLVKQVESMTNKMQDMEKIFNLRREELSVELTQTWNDFQQYKLENNERYTELMNKMNELSELHKYTMNKYVSYKHENTKIIKQLSIRNIQLNDDNKVINQQCKHKLKNEMNMLKHREKKIKSDSASMVHIFRKEIVSKTDELNHIQTQYRKLNDTFNEQITRLKCKLSRVEKRNRKLGKQKSLERQGFVTDFKLLNQQLKKLQMWVGKQVKQGVDCTSLQRDIDALRSEILEKLEELHVYC